VFFFFFSLLFFFFMLPYSLVGGLPPFPPFPSLLFYMRTRHTRFCPFPSPFFPIPIFLPTATKASEPLPTPPSPHGPLLSRRTLTFLQPKSPSLSCNDESRASPSHGAAFSSPLFRIHPLPPPFAPPLRLLIWPIMNATPFPPQDQIPAL